MRRVVERTERTGERALRWSIDDIGGPNTLRSVWLRLKNTERLRGVKRKGCMDDSIARMKRILLNGVKEA